MSTTNVHQLKFKATCKTNKQQTLNVVHQDSYQREPYEISNIT